MLLDCYHCTILFLGLAFEAKQRKQCNQGTVKYNELWSFLPCCVEIHLAEERKWDSNKILFVHNHQLDFYHTLFHWFPSFDYFHYSLALDFLKWPNPHLNNLFHCIHSQFAIVLINKVILLKQNYSSSIMVSCWKGKTNLVFNFILLFTAFCWIIIVNLP